MQQRAQSHEQFTGADKARQAGTVADGNGTPGDTLVAGDRAVTLGRMQTLAERVVIVGSRSHKTGETDLDDARIERRTWIRHRSYSQSTLADMLSALELDRRLGKAGSKITTAIAQPGWATTGILGVTGIAPLDQVIEAAGAELADTPEPGAAATLYSMNPDVPSEAYVRPDGRFGLRGDPVLVGRAPKACDFPTTGLLWEFGL